MHAIAMRYTHMEAPAPVTLPQPAAILVSGCSLHADCTLVLNDIHKAPPSVLPLLEREVALSSTCGSYDEEEDGSEGGDGDGSG